MRPLLVVLLLLAVSACGAPAAKPELGNPLAVASCPAALPPLEDGSFGATVSKLGEVVGIYHRCRRAALGVQPK